MFTENIDFSLKKEKKKFKALIWFTFCKYKLSFAEKLKSEN